ncbi:MAG TPA: DUF3500 domain-containing protein [Chthoniobacteraceae bacterium]|nr:DUF3500 domain-containing protein [Chthoniobacteraceae bacterium]
MKTGFAVSLALLLGISATLRAHEASAEMAQAANNYLNALTPEEKAKGVFDFKDGERTNWHFIPRARKGLPIKEMTQEQRLLAHALLASGLSHRGYGKAVSIMSLETVLAELEKGKGPARDPEMYFFSIFGKPGGTEPWGWRVEGHHLSLNFTANGATTDPALTPSFFGTNPGEVRNGPRTGTRILGAEEELGRQLVKSLNDEQRKSAIILPEAPKDIINVPGRNETKPQGLAQSKMSPEQAIVLTKLIHEYLDRHRPDVAADEWAKIEKSGIGNVHFAWAGGVERGQPHYYRVQGSTFVLEYDNTQNGANHVHSVWRDFANDFGADILKAHYDDAHAPSK